LTNNNEYWAICNECYGLGKRGKKVTRKLRKRRHKLPAESIHLNTEDTQPEKISGHLFKCIECNGSGLVRSEIKPIIDSKNYPHVAIIGAGIGGVALAVACLHRGIPFTLYERDNGFNDRSQGYGLTLQQASKAIEGLGIFKLEEGIISTKHVVHATDGKILGEWGMRKYLQDVDQSYSKRKNVHIARQALRMALLEQLGGNEMVNWGHQLIHFNEPEQEGVELSFHVNNETITAKADLVIGADGIRSSVRRMLIGEDATPLRYLGCIVILGICPLENLNGYKNELLDSATVFQTANGVERIYLMPYSADAIMWQFSCPMSENEAKALSAKGAKALKEEAIRRMQWHEPIPQILAATNKAQISGYPVYDRELLNHELLKKSNHITLIGDAAHPMSPFKGQGANQALLDALALARGISKGCRPSSNWQASGIRESVLNDFETEMLNRSASKVKDSAEAAQFLHSESVLQESNGPRRRDRNELKQS
jgi:2-polyprenyl-6-methoxyphenol hydroxylase-like FAD-dependent oxidoreductase